MRSGEYKRESAAAINESSWSISNKLIFAGHRMVILRAMISAQSSYLKQ